MNIASSSWLTTSLAATGFPTSLKSERIQRFLLTTLLIVYFLVPTTLPWTGWSPHGLVLLCAMAYYAMMDLRRFPARQSWPFVLPLLALAMSWFAVGGDADMGTVRAVGFGTCAAFLVSEYLRGHYGTRALLALAVAVAAVSVGMSGSYVAATLGAGVTQFDPFAALFGQSSYHSALFFLVAIPTVSFLAARRGSVMSLLLLPLWMGLILTGIRGVWLGALVATLVFGVASKRLLKMTLNVGVALLAFALMTSLSERYLADLNHLRAVQSGGVHATPSEFAPEGDTSATAFAAGSLAAKTRAGKGTEKFYEELTTSGRVGYWLTGIKMWASSPILGVGPGNFATYSDVYVIRGGPRRDAEKSFDAHNMFVSVLAELGIVGFGLLLTLLAISLYRWLRCWREKSLSRDGLALVGAIFAGLTVVGLTWDIHMQRIWWISLGLLWGATIPLGESEDRQGVH